MSLVFISAFPSENWEKGLTIYTVTITYAVPLMIIIACYTKIIKKIIGNTIDTKSDNSQISKNYCSKPNQKNVFGEKREPFLKRKNIVENKFVTSMMINQSYDDKDDQVFILIQFKINS